MSVPAVVVAVGFVAVGLVLATWLWWLAPQVDGVETLRILGQPILAQQLGEGATYKAYVPLLNAGSTSVTVLEDGVVVGGTACRLPKTALEPGEFRAIVATCLFEYAIVEHVVGGLIIADGEALTTGFEVRNARPEVPRL